MLLLIRGGCAIPRLRYRCCFSCIRDVVIRLYSAWLLWDVSCVAVRRPATHWPWLRIVYTLPWKWTQKSTTAASVLPFCGLKFLYMWHGMLTEGTQDESGNFSCFCEIRDGFWICCMRIWEQNALLLWYFRILLDSWIPRVCMFKLLGYVLSLYRPAWLIKLGWHW